MDIEVAPKLSYTKGDTAYDYGVHADGTFIGHATKKFYSARKPVWEAYDVAGARVGETYRLRGDAGLALCE